MPELEPLPGVPSWEMWSVTVYVTRSMTWHARPVGAPQAVVHADSVPRLVTAVVEWLDRPQSEIDAAVADLRRKLDDTSERYEHTRNHLAACIETELVALRTRAGMP
jgi:hypothetical protein